MRVEFSERQSGPRRNRQVRLVPNRVIFDFSTPQDFPYIRALQQGSFQARERAAAARQTLSQVAEGRRFMTLSDFLDVEASKQFWEARGEQTARAVDLFLNPPSDQATGLGFRGEVAVAVYEGVMAGIGILAADNQVATDELLAGIENIIPNNWVRQPALNGEEA